MHCPTAATRSKQYTKGAHGAAYSARVAHASEQNLYSYAVHLPRSSAAIIKLSAQQAAGRTDQYHNTLSLVQFTLLLTHALPCPCVCQLLSPFHPGRWCPACSSCRSGR